MSVSMATEELSLGVLLKSDEPDVGGSGGGIGGGLRKGGGGSGDRAEARLITEIQAVCCIRRGGEGPDTLIRIGLILFG